MKKIYLIITLLALISCQKNFNNIFAPTENEIYFTTNSLTTKSFKESTAQELKNNGFNVVGVQCSDNSILLNEKVTYNSSSSCFLVPEKHFFYPLNESLNFFSVYPTSETISIDTDGTASLNYSHSCDKDLIIASASEIKKRKTPVEMNFTHILSQVSITAKNDNSDVDCKLYKLQIIDSNGGEYLYETDNWELNETVTGYNFYNSTKGKTINTTATEIDEPKSLLPGTVKLNAVWTTYEKGTSNVIKENDATVTVTLEKGKHSVLNITLPNRSNDIRIELSLKEWGEIDKDVALVDPVGPETLPGVFTVNGSGKKVKFSPGNLYWDGSEFKCEEHQYDYPTAWNPNHVAHFYWSKDAAIAVAETYNDPEASADDKFFAADGGAIDGYTVLSEDEWLYLINNNRLAKNSSMEYEIVIDGINCLVLKPDGFNGTVADSYTAAEWATAEASGLVALPFAGDCYDTYMEYLGSDGYYWLSTVYDSRYAYHTYFYSDAINIEHTDRQLGRSVRLVSVQ